MAFILFGTSFLFVNSHLTAHEENVRDRVRDLKKINAMMNLPKTLPYRKSKKFQLTGSGDFTDNFDCVFWCGDLNFRLGMITMVLTLGGMYWEPLIGNS